MLILENVERMVPAGRFHKRCLFTDLTLEFMGGEITGLIGKSGRGKSTLLEMAALERRPDDGSVVLDGHTFNFASRTSIASAKANGFSYVRQTPDLFDELSVLQNLHVGLQFSGIDESEWDSIGEIYANHFGIDHLLDQPTAGLSGGERHRVCLARAICRRPSVLVCDEPTASLDAATSDLVIDALRNLCDVQNSIVILATHDPQLIAACDQIFDMDQINGDPLEAVA